MPPDGHYHTPPLDKAAIREPFLTLTLQRHTRTGCFSTAAMVDGSEPEADL